MQQRELMSAFSELKNLLIRTYQIKQDRKFVKLYFSRRDNQMLMHDYDDHKKAIIICFDIEQKDIRNSLTPNGRRLVRASLKHPSPSEFLNEEFQLNGFFRS